MAGSMQVDGLISGLNTTDLITSMMAIEKQPLVQLQNKQTTLQTHSDALSAVSAKLTALKTAIQTLARPGTFNARTVSTDTPSSQSPAVVATANGDSAVGSFKLTISQLATSTKVTGTTVGATIATDKPLSQAGFGIAPTAGFFTINGKQITINSTTTLDGTSGTSVVEMINASGAGVTASVSNNQLVLTSDSPIKLGSGADTSNFLTAAKVLAAPDTGTGATHQIASTGNLGVTQTTASLANARFATPLALPVGTTAGSFTINGVTINYDTANDSLNNVISRINASSAGVTAAYDSQLDRLTLTAKATGSSTIQLKDVTGNFLAATGLTADGAQTLGQNAAFSIDTVNGGQPIYSASNTISGVVPGVTLNLKAQTTSPVTVSVAQDTSAAVSAIKDFISQYNSAVSYIRDQTKWDSATKTGGPLLGSSEVTGVEVRLRQLITSIVGGASGKYASLADVGVTSGAIGSAAGTTDSLTLDEDKLTAALQDNPTAVARLFIAPDPTVSLQSGGAGALASVNRSTTATPRAGKYVVTSTIGSDGTTNLSVVFTPTGGTAYPATTGTIAAGGSNTTLAYGLVLNAKNPPVAGTDTIVVTPGDSVTGRVGSYLDSLISTTGVLTTSSNSDLDEITQLGKQIADKQEMLDQKQATLQQQFATLESTLAQLQSQSGQIASAITSLGGYSSSSSSSN